MNVYNIVEQITDIESGGGFDVSFLFNILPQQFSNDTITTNQAVLYKIFLKFKY